MEYIAFQTVDEEGDIWANTALLFSTEEAVEAFFAEPEIVIGALDYQVNPDESIENCITIHRSSTSNNITAATINLESCGKMRIARMSKGFVVS